MRYVREYYVTDDYSLKTIQEKEKKKRRKEKGTVKPITGSDGSGNVKLECELRQKDGLKF